MTLNERYDLASDADLLARVKLAAVKTAINVAGEDATLLTNATERRDLARLVLHRPQAWAEIIIYGVLVNPNVGSGTDDPTEDSTSGDSALEFTVASLWDDYT